MEITRAACGDRNPPHQVTIYSWLEESAPLSKVSVCLRLVPFGSLLSVPLASVAVNKILPAVEASRGAKPYTDLGTDYFDRRDRERIKRHHIHRLEQLGYAVTLVPKEAA